MSSEEKFNLKNPAVKRIMQEVKEMKNNPSDDYMSLPLEDNIFEWQFAIRGPRDTEFEGGIYHGRIQLPSDYPLKPPSFLLLTPNGRFETNTKICLSISNYHPEHWQPSWSVRTALVALIAFMPSKPEGAVGSLDYSKEERIALAARSRTHPPKFGNEDRQKLIDEIHEYMLKKSSMPEKSPATENESTCQSSVCTDECHSDVISSSESHTVEERDEPQIAQHMEERTASVEHTEYGRAIPSSNQESMVQHQMVEHDNRHLRRNFKTRQQKSADEKGLTMLAVGLSVAIVALLIKKFLKSYWWISP